MSNNGTTSDQRLAAQAFHAARRLLFARHEAEFQQLVRSERIARGLRPESGVQPESTEFILAKLDRARSRSTKYREQLAGRGVEL